MRERIIKAIKYISFFILIGVGYAEICSLTGFGIPCLFRTVTGYKCPGCGITHMFMHLLKADFRAAFSDNQVAFVLFPVFILATGYHVGGFIRYGRFYYSKVENIACYIIIAILLGWCVVRNLKL